MNRQFRFAIGGIFLIAALQSEAGVAGWQAAQKPVKDFAFHMDGLPEEPLNLDELWKGAEAVVEGTVEAAFNADVQIPNTDPVRYSIFTDYQVRISEVYKPDANLQLGATTVMVRRFGGVRDRGANIERHFDKDFPLFETGERYILFLKLLPSNSRYEVAAGGAEGAYLVRSTTIRARGKSQLADTLSSNPFMFREALRKQRGVR